MADLAAILAMLGRDGTVHLTDQQPDPSVFQMFDNFIAVRRLADGGYLFQCHIVCNDGSCGQGWREETLDEGAASERLAALLAEGLDLDHFKMRRR